MKQVRNGVCNRYLSIRIFCITCQWAKCNTCRYWLAIYAHRTHSTRLRHHIHIVLHLSYRQAVSLCLRIGIFNRKGRDKNLIQALLNRCHIHHRWVTKRHLCSIVFDMKIVTTCRSKILIADSWARSLHPSTSTCHPMFVGLIRLQSLFYRTIHLNLGIIINSSYTSKIISRVILSRGNSKLLSPIAKWNHLLKDMVISQTIVIRHTRGLVSREDCHWSVSPNLGS